MQLEDGTVRGGVEQVDNFTPPFDLDGRWVGEASFLLPADLPLGYHRVHLRSGDSETSTALIVTPDWLGLPERLGARRAWGLAAQLYSVRSRQSWGVGDLTDLTDLAVWSASRHGADYLLVNPLHAAAPTKPMEPSPYLPTSRRFVNPIYLHVEAIPEFADLTKRSRVRRLRSEVQQRAGRVDAIDRDSSWAAKRAALKLLHQEPRSAGRELSYAAFRDREGRALDDFATWCALAEEHGARLAFLARGAPAPGCGRDCGLRRKAFGHSRFPPLAAVATRRAARRGAVAGDPGRHVAGRHA